jgi:uncharacterized DUF497 family protein
VTRVRFLPVPGTVRPAAAQAAQGRAESPSWRYNCYTVWVRFHFDRRKSERLRRNLKRGIGLEEALELFSHSYYQDNRSDLPEQHRAIGWVGERLYTVIFEVREDEEGEFYHLVTLWKATREERTLYEENS